MSLSSFLSEDFESVAGRYDFGGLRNSSVLVTGASGLIGIQLILFLDYLNQNKDYGIKIHALCRSEEKARRVFQDSCSRIHCVFGDVLSPPPVTDPLDYIIHGASFTSSLDFVGKAVETIDTAVNGTLNMLRLAKDKAVRSFLYLSSMEVFGITDGGKEVKEEDLGYIDILSPRSSYPESKRMCECLCACCAAEYGIPAKIVRLTQTLGPGIAYGDTRCTAQFARAAIEGHDIVLKTAGATKRPALYTADAVSAILTVLLKGKDARAYTAANPDTFVTIKETAGMVAQDIAGGRIRVVHDINGVPAEYAQNLKLNLDLNIDKISALGWRPAVGLKEAYSRMIRWMELERKERGES